MPYFFASSAVIQKSRTYKPSEMAAAISGFNVSEGSFAEDVTRLAVEMQDLLPREAEDGEY